MAFAFLTPTPDDKEQLERVLEVGLVIQFTLLFARLPGRHLRPFLWVEHDLLAAVYPVGCMLAALLTVSLVLRRPLLGQATFPVIVTLFGVASVWMLWASPQPLIDVFHLHRESAAAMLRGRTPYDLHLPNFYGHTLFFGPGFATPTSIDTGSPYPPLSVVLTSLATYSLGDPRIALAAAILGGALLIDQLGGRAARLSALLYLSTPRRFLVLELGWTEPLMVALLAATLLLAQRRSRWLTVGFAGLLGIKQFSVVLLPLTPLLVGELRPGRVFRLVLGAVFLVALTAVPFVLWDPHAFLRSTVTFHLSQPFRPDSLNLAAFWASVTDRTPPTTVPMLVLTGLAILWALRRCRLTPAGFAAGGALVLFALFAWSKQAHCNYYDLVIGFLACAIALAPPPGPAAAVRNVP